MLVTPTSTKTDLAGQTQVECKNILKAEDGVTGFTYLKIGNQELKYASFRNGFMDQTILDKYIPDQTTANSIGFKLKDKMDTG